MTPAAIIREAAAAGVSLALSPTGTIKAVGNQVAVDLWVPLLREHKPAILAALAAETPDFAGAPVNLDEALRAACEDVGGITPEVFRSLLSPEDVADIAAGDIHRKTLKGFAASFAEGIQSGRVVVLGERTPSP